MAEHKPLYRQSFSEAQRSGELEDWRASHQENIACRDFIDDAIRQNYQDNRLGGDVVGDAIAEFGFDRVNWVLANTVQHYDYDGRFSNANKAWAKGVFIPRGKEHDITGDFLLQAHPGLVDLVANQARQAYEQLHMFDAQQCISVYEFQDVVGHVLVLNPDVLKDEYKTPESQLFLAERGFGCKPRASGRAVFGTFLADGEQARFNRQDFLGVLKPELLPEWAVEKLATSEQEQTTKPLRIKVFQINPDRDSEHRCFESLKPRQPIDPAIYDEVYSGPVPSIEPEMIFQQFNVDPPPLHRGRSMSVSDVVEVNGAYHYVNPVGFEQIDFDTSLTQKPENLLRVVALVPNLPAYEAELGPDLKSMQRAVGGLIEVTYPFKDNAVILGNDEAKLIGMEGNRRIASQVYAGPLYIIGDNGDGEFCSLTDAQAEAYTEQFAQPEDISMEEVQADTGFTMYGFN